MVNLFATAKMMPRQTKILFLFFLLCLQVRWGMAQLDQMEFERYTVHHGLSNNAVYAITQDTRGYIWIGTENGLSQFDGVSVEDLMRRSEELRDMALRRFESLNPQLARGPRDTSACPCRRENGGSGVCGCTLGGPQVTC